jgi:hypothetical protein
MTTSATYAFNPSLGELVLYAYGLCGVRNTALLAEHMETAKMAANMLQSRWSAQGVNLWAVDLQTVTLVEGTATYDVPASTIAMLDAYVTTGSGTTQNNRILLPISRSEYSTYPNPNMQGFPTVYWFDRLLSPTVTLWPVPDGNEVSLSYYRMRQIQDATLAGGLTVEIPYYFLEAAALGLAYRLALTYAPDKMAGLKALADEAYAIAIDQNVETAQQYISPMVSSYWRP